MAKVKAAATGFPGQSAFETRPAHEQRHGERLKVRIPLLLEVGGLRDASWTVTANEGGALVSFPRPVAEGERVLVHNVTTGKAAVARVVATLLADSEPAGHRSGGGFRMALRLETFPEHFWGPVYYTSARTLETVH
jgi:hypothetical protein